MLLIDSCFSTPKGKLVYLVALCPKIGHTHYTALKINRTRVEGTACVTCKSRPTTKTRPVSYSTFKYNTGSDNPNYLSLWVISPSIKVKSVKSALSDLLTTSATHGTFSRPSTKRGLTLIGLELNTNARESLLIISSESVNRSTCLSVCLIITRLRNVNLLCFSDSIEGIDFLNCTLKCPVTLKLANQNRYFYYL